MSNRISLASVVAPARAEAQGTLAALAGARVRGHDENAGFSNANYCNEVLAGTAVLE